MSQPISVHVWSDIACPWCYIGKRRFERGAQQFGGDVTVEYHSFELSPDTPVDFEGTAADYLAERKGMEHAQVEQMLAQVTQLAAEEGLDYDFAAVRHTKTLKAHELLHLAKARGVQLDLVERLFSAYFEQGRHVGHDDELVALAVEVGLDAGEARDALTEGRFTVAVQQDIAAAAQLGVSGVPFFVVDGRYGVSGAQSAETFATVLQRVAAERVAQEEAGASETDLDTVRG